jgi:hypothetical protein
MMPIVQEAGLDTRTFWAGAENFTLIAIRSPDRLVYRQTQHRLRLPGPVKRNTVEPRFTNLIRSWRPFVNRNIRKPKLS